MEFAINNDVTDVKLSEIDDNKENAKYIICSQIKKQGKQKSFCEEKFLNSEEVFIYFFLINIMDQSS